MHAHAEARVCGGWPRLAVGLLWVIPQRVAGSLRQCYLTQSIYTVILQKSTLAQIRRRILYYDSYKDTLTNLYGNRLLQTDFKNTLCETKTLRKSRPHPLRAPARVVSV